MVGRVREPPALGRSSSGIRPSIANTNQCKPPALPRARSPTCRSTSTSPPTLAESQDAVADASRPHPVPGTSSSSAPARPAAWRRSSSPRPASRCWCSRPGACSTGRRSTGRWSGPTSRFVVSACRPTCAASNVAEYNFLDRPVRQSPAVREVQKADQLRGQLASPATGSSTRRRTRRPARRTPGCARASSGARRTSGAAARCATDRYEFKAASHDGFDVDWPIGYEDVKPYYDKVDLLLGCSGTDRRASTRCRTACSRRPSKLNCIETVFRSGIATMGRKLHSRSRRRDHRRRPEQQVPAALHAARPLRSRLRPQRVVPLADGADLPGARHRQPDAAPVLGRARGAPRRGDEQGHEACGSSTRRRARSWTSRRASSYSAPAPSTRRASC